MTRSALRLSLEDDPPPAGPDGTWWPQSRVLAVELRDLVDHFPADAGRVRRLLFSRPDWDDAVDDQGRGVRKIMTSRGQVKVGSFPRDDTRLVIATMSNGVRLHLAVVHQAVHP